MWSAESTLWKPIGQWPSFFKKFTAEKEREGMKDGMKEIKRGGRGETYKLKET